MTIANILYFPHPARGGGIERNFALWFGYGRTQYQMKIAAHETPAFCETSDVISCHFLPMVKFICSDICADGARLFVFRGVMKPLLLKWFLQIFCGRSTELFFRASNDPSHWRYERSVTRALSEVAKRVFLRFYTGIIYNSEELMQRCRPYGGQPFLLRNAVESKDNIRFRSAEKKEFLFVGRNARQKNIAQMIAAFAQLGPDYRLTMVGVGPQSDLPENVEAIEWQSSIDYEGFHYFIMPSLYEGAPNALLEAVNNGLIAVMTPFCSGGREILSAFGAPGHLAEGFSADDIAAAVRRIAAERIEIDSETPPAFSSSVFEATLDSFLGS